MKVLILASLSQSLINFRGKLIASMLEAGHEVFCVAPDDEAAAEVHRLGASFYRVSLARSGLNPFADLRYLKDLTVLFRRLKPDFLLSYTIKPVVYGSLAARFAGIRNCFAIITGLGFAFMGETYMQKLAGLIAKTLYRVALRYNLRVFFQNPDDLKEFLDSRLVSSDQAVQVNGSGVDLESFAAASLDVETPRYLLIARLLREKGIFEYCEAARIVKKALPAAEFRLIGPLDPSPSGISLEQITAITDGGGVQYLGGVDDVRSHIVQANVYVLPSYREGTPRTVLEAMAMGRPIVTTDVPGCRETVVHNRNGFLVPARNIEELAKAMIKVFESPTRLLEMGLESRLIAERKFDVNVVNRIILTNMHLER